MPRANRYDNLPPIDMWGADTTEPEIVAAKQPVSASIQNHTFELNEKDSIVGRLATVSLHDGDTLLDIARHYGVGYEHIVAANPGVDIWVPQQGVRAILPTQFTLPNAKRAGVVINIATMRLFYFKSGKQPGLSTWPIGIGREGRSTPLGAMAIARKMQHPTWYPTETIRRTHAEQGDPLPSVVPPGPDNPLGDFALYLSKPSYLIHGTNKPFSIGLRASNGCIRLYPEDIAQAFKQIPANTPVNIVNQPYLLGWLDGVLYLEAHEPFEEVDADVEVKNLKGEIQRLTKDSQHKIDWPKVDETLKKKRGIPIPIFENTPSLNDMLVAAPQLERPAQLLGQPDKAEPGKLGWFIHSEAIDEYRAKKLAAQMNHFGPRIPAHTVATAGGFQVVGGPFAKEQGAIKAKNALGEDFNTKSEIVRPSKTDLAMMATAAAEAKKQIKPEQAKPDKAEPGKTTVSSEPAKPAKSTESAKPNKAEPVKPAASPEQPKTAISPKPDKPVERKPPHIILKLPKPEKL